MPSKKQDDDKDMKPAALPETPADHGEVEVPPPNPETGRVSATPDSGTTPMNYGPRGDARPMTDAGLSPDAQQPGESYEDFIRRRPEAKK